MTWLRWLTHPWLSLRSRRVSRRLWRRAAKRFGVRPRWFESTASLSVRVRAAYERQVEEVRAER